MTYLRKLVDTYLIKYNRIPYKTIKLSTGVVADHYKSGLITIRYE